MAHKRAWLSYVSDINGWLDARSVAAIREELPWLAEEIVRTVQREVPEYARPLRGDFGQGLRLGTEQALRRFIGEGGGDSPSVYRNLGYGEHQAGRSLDNLQSAYRIGARVAWRRMSRAAEAAGAGAETQRSLAEAMFAYIDQLAAESVEGYAEAQLARAGDLARGKAALLSMLLSIDPPENARLARAAADARWPLPRTLACMAIDRDAGRMARRLSGDVLHGTIDGIDCLVVGDPTNLAEEAATAASQLGAHVGVGPTVQPFKARLSLRWATLACELASKASAVVAEDRLADIALRASPEIVRQLRSRALAPLEGESARSRLRLESTLRAWLRHRGSQGAIAAELSVHPQTVRYRLRRLRELFGAALEDPERRFELEIALRDLPANAARLAGASIESRGTVG
jgi:hypothetical protein